MKSRGAGRTFWSRVEEAMRAHPRYRDRATQVEAAKLARVSQGTVSEWNLAGRAAKLKNGCQLAERLNVCVEWLYMERGPMRPLPPDDAYLRELMSVWAQIKPEDKARIVAFAQVTAHGAPFTEPSPKSLQPSRAAS